MNAYKNYVLTVGNIEASILAAEGTDEYISTLLQVTDERMVETVRRLRIDATKYVLVNSKDRQEDFVLLVVLQTSNFWKSLQMSYLTDSGRGSR